MPSLLFPTVIKQVKSCISLRSVKSSPDLKQSRSPSPISPSINQQEARYTTAQGRGAEQLIELIDQIRESAEEVIPILATDYIPMSPEEYLPVLAKAEAEALAKAKGKEKTKQSTRSTSVTPQEAAYYEGLLEDYFEKDDPAILRELGVGVSRSRAGIST